MLEYQKELVIQLRGLHISICFLKVVGNNKNESGLVEAWVESGILGPNTTEHVMYGKPTKEQCVLTRSVAAADAFPARFLLEIVPGSSSSSSSSEENANFTFWWNYMEMDSILLILKQAHGEGIGERPMLPYFFQV